MANGNAVNGFRQTTGTGSPIGVLTGFVGDQYFDTTNFIFYVSTGTSWVQQSPGQVSTLVTAATTTNIAGSYSNGTYTFTTAGVVPIDGQSFVVGNNYLFKDLQQQFNGIYTCVTAPASGVQGVVTRASNYQTAQQIINTDNIYVLSGTTNSAQTFRLRTNGYNITVGTTNLQYYVPVQIAQTQISQTQSYALGTPLNNSDLLISLTSLPTNTAPMTFVDATNTTQTMVQNTAYLADATSAATTFSLPTSISVGSILQVTHNAFGTSTGWKITQNANQQIVFGTLKTTAGVNGYLNSTANGNSVTLLCTVANTNLIVIASQGNINAN